MAASPGRGNASQRVLAVALGGVTTAEALLAAALSVVVGWSWSDALHTYVVTNGLIGLAFALCGAVIARNRPRNPIGWLFVADGVGHTTAAVMAPTAQALHDAAASIVLQRTALTVLQWSWPWSIGLLLPVALLLFPDGRLPSPRWRSVLVLLIATAPLFVLEIGTDPTRLRSGLPAAPSATMPTSRRSGRSANCARRRRSPARSSG